MPNSILKEGKILIIDDERANIRFLEIVLQQAGYHNVFSTMDSRQALFLCSELKPDLLLLDLHMPHLDGFAVMQILQTQSNLRSFPILVLTADGTVPIRHRALAEGAKDFLIKPLDELEVLLRIHNLLETELPQRTARSEGAGSTTFYALHVRYPHLAFSSSRPGRQGSHGESGLAAVRRHRWREHHILWVVNYLTACERVSGRGAGQAWAVARGIRQIMAGATGEFHLEYPCYSPEEQRWFTVRVTPFVGEGPMRVVVAHENTTELKRVEGELERALSEAAERSARETPL